MTPVMVKVYGYLRPVSPEQVKILQESLASMGGEADDILQLGGTLVNISYEGVFFPIDDFLDAATPLVQSGAIGKVDYIDMEGWSLTRYSFDDGKITKAQRDLNSVMAYSGH